jgi:tetraacyldisaccharide 4'-kinase
MMVWENALLSGLLKPFAWLYGSVIALRNTAFDRKLRKQVRLDAKVISVGNLTVGGTGKTPLVVTVATMLLEQGKKVAIQSRGYGRRSKGTVIVSDGNKILATPQEAGDEPYLLAMRLPQVPVVVGDHRAEAAAFAIQKFNCDVLLLDDAYQHRRIYRDMDILTMDASQPWGNGQVLPAGPLREHKRNVNRAHLIVLTRAENGNLTMENLLSFETLAKVPVVSTTHQPVHWINLKTGDALELDALRGRFVLAFTGIGNPTSFLNTLKSLHIEPVDFICYKDHHWFKRQETASIFKRAEQHGAIAVVTTEKDGVRLMNPVQASLPVYSLRITQVIKTGENAFKQAINACFMS